jgi:ketosteroid isomerase-like protein
MSQGNVSLVQDIYTSFASGDVPRVLSLFSEDIHWNEADNFLYADGNPYVGPSRVLEGVFMRLGADWEGFTVNAEEFLDAGDTVIALGRYRGKYKSNGREVYAQFAHVWRVKGEKIVGFQQYTDTAQFQRAASS